MLFNTRIERKVTSFVCKILVLHQTKTFLIHNSKIVYLCNMKNKIKFPYGVSNAEVVTTEGYTFIDKTPFVELLEENERFASFLRPRRIGKSFFISILEYYYDLRQKHKFEKIFGKTYIGQNPTPLASSFRVLKFNFSGLDTRTNESSEKGFLLSVKKSIGTFLASYNFLDEKAKEEILTQHNAAEMITTFFGKYKEETISIYLLIDEYDHFTNEILIRNLTEFKTSVSKDGYVRKFYETIKIATEDGSVGRFFITGVSPITLDSLTSGFNIVKHLTHSLDFNDLAGFTEENVKTLLELVLEDKTRLKTIMQDLKWWYNGYKFNMKAKGTIYNANMVLYFLDNFKNTQEYPTQMLDPNIMPDYGKLKQMFEVANIDENTKVLEEILETDEIETEQIYQFDLSHSFGKIEFVNFLYYLGNLTIKKAGNFGIDVVYKIPNYVIAELYWKYYAYVLRQRNELQYPENEVPKIMRALAGGNVEGYLHLVESNLKALSNRDFQRFDEKYVKMIMLLYAIESRIFYVPTERETSTGGYVDLEIYIRSNNPNKHAQYIFEIKYIKKEDEKTFEKVKEGAIKQLQNYRDNDTFLQEKEDLHAIVVIFVKDELYWEEV